MRKSFNKIHMVEDVYLRYIQFRTLHRRFYTNDKLFKMKIKESSLCDMCKIDEDSVEHMLIKCSKSRNLWRDVEIWLSEVGLADYIIDEQTIILGENKKSFWINAIILITKKVIFNAKLNCKIPNIFCQIPNKSLIQSWRTEVQYITKKWKFCEKMGSTDWLFWGTRIITETCFYIFCMLQSIYYIMSIYTVICLHRQNIVV